MIKTKYITENGKEFEDLREAQVEENWLIRQQSKNLAQDLVFELMKIGSFNGFNGEKYVEKLKKRHDLWKAVLFDVDSYTLRDLKHGMWFSDSLRIVPEEGKKEELFKWVKRNLFPDEIGWKKLNTDYQGNPMEDEQLELWWD